MMKEVSMNKDVKLSPHFTLGELTRTSYHTLDGNIPSHMAIENLRNLCENWLEDLRYGIVGETGTWAKIESHSGACPDD